MKPLELSSPVISTTWLSENLTHPDLIILDATIPKVAGSKPEHLNQEKIQGARFFDIKGVFSDKETNVPNMLPSAEIFEKACSELGICDHHTLVVYDQLGIYSSPRVWWMFKVMGFNNIAILDGGLPAWNKESLPTETISIGDTSYPKGDFVAKHRPEFVSNADDILSEIIDRNTLILDARSEGRFKALEPEPRSDLKGGHIPTSKSLWYGHVLKDQHMHSIPKLKETFENFNIENKKLIFTCGSGITACIILLAAELAGYRNQMSVYDGSWSEWGQLEGVPIEH